MIKIRLRTLRSEHLNRLTSQYKLARAYLQINKTVKAIALLKPVLEIRSRTLRPDHWDRVCSIYTLAQCHYKAKNYEKALQLAKSIEDVAQNRPGQEIADWNEKLMGWILEDMDIESAI